MKGLAVLGLLYDTRWRRRSYLVAQIDNFYSGQEEPHSYAKIGRYPVYYSTADSILPNMFTIICIVIIDVRGGPTVAYWPA